MIKFNLGEVFLIFNLSRYTNNLFCYHIKYSTIALVSHFYYDNIKMNSNKRGCQITYA